MPIDLTGTQKCARRGIEINTVGMGKWISEMNAWCGNKKDLAAAEARAGMISTSSGELDDDTCFSTSQDDCMLFM